MKSGVGYLLDTCVISELIRAEPSPKVMEWIDGQDEESLYLSVITLGEVEKGISKLAEACAGQETYENRCRRTDRVEKKLQSLLSLINTKWPGTKPLRLMFQDEARFGRITDTRQCWCPRPVRPLSMVTVTQEYTYAYAAVSVRDGALDTLILPTVNSGCMQIFLDEISSRYSEDRIVMILDGAGWHKSSTLKTPKNMRLISLPPYSPELNPVEHLWDELRDNAFGNIVFNSLHALEDHLESSLREMEHDTPRVHSIVAWPWIMDSLLI